MTTDTLKPEELRIGNWLLYDEDGKWTYQRVQYVAKDLDGYKGYYVSFGWASTTLQGDISNFDDWELYVKGIPLTPEILEKCGFYQLPHFTVHNGFYINIGRKRVISVGCVGTPNEMVFISEEQPPEVKNLIVARNFDYDGKTYLHQLQNLYYALTQTELQIQL